MILIGQYDSSFVRRIGIALTHYGIGFEHRPWSVFGDAEKIAPYNPLLRVPVLVLDDGVVLTDCNTILFHLDSIAPHDRLLSPLDPAERTLCLSVMAFSGGLADKAVSLFYEKRLHENPSAPWMERCNAQIAGTAQRLEVMRAARTGRFWFGDAMTHADIAVAASWRHAVTSHSGMLPDANHPAIAAHNATMEALPEFLAIYQDFIPPT